MRMKIKNRILASVLSFLIIIATAFSGVTTAKAAEGNTFDDGYYQTLLDITDWAQTQGAANGIRISQRAFIIGMSNGKLNAMQIEVTGYSQYSAIYMVKQDATNVTEINIAKGGKIGEWSDITNYSALKEAGYVEAELNDSFIKLEPDSVDSVKDTAIFTLNNYSGYDFDCMKKVGLVGCIKREMSTVSAQCSSITFQANPKYMKTTRLAAYIDYNETGVKLYTNLNTWNYGSEAMVTNSANWNSTSAFEPSAIYSLKERNIDKTEYSISDGKLIAKIYLKDILKTDGTEVYELESRTSENVTKDKYYKAYLAGNFGVTWGTDNLYSADEGCITLSFDSHDLLYGKTLKFYVPNMGKSYETVSICLSEYDYSPKTIEDGTYGILYRDSFKCLPDGVKLDVTLNTSEDAINSIKKVSGEGKYIVYTLNLMKDGEVYSPDIKGNVYVPIPDEWDIDSSKFYAETSYTNIYEGKEYFGLGSSYPDVLKVESINGHNYIRCSMADSKIINGGNIAICQVKQKQDVSSLEEGTYKVDVSFLKAGTAAQTSMASGTLDNEAYMTVDASGNKAIYLGFHGLDMGGNINNYTYMGALWNVSDEDVTYFDFETDENGALLNNCTFDAIDEFPCVKSAKINISESSWDAENKNYRFKVIPPAMGSGDPYNYVYSNPIDADLVFFNVEKLDTAPQIPTYQKAVLRRSIDKAGRYTESSYSTESWAVLAAALKDGKAYYDELAGTDAGTDNSISDNIKAKSDAIEDAIKNLAENTELVTARENLKKAIEEAEKITIGDKTTSAFDELAAVITESKAIYARSNVTIETLNTQIETLNKAVETFNNSASASELDPTNLADGEYKVYVNMKKVDRVTDSMSDNAIDHWINLSVKDGVYIATIDFKGMTISGQFGYLMNLNYYDAGYSYASTGDPTGTLKPATVLTTQKNADGSDVIDGFNNKDSLYPDTLSFPLVDKGTQEYEPLQVFVPIMENITEGTGTQNVLMKIDWTSLKSADDNTQETVNLDDGLYTVSGEIREADSDAVSTWNNYLDKVRLVAEGGKITAYIDFKSVSGKTVAGISTGEAQSAAVKDSRAVVVLPENVELTDVQLTDNKGETVNARLYLALRSASVQKVDKTSLKKFIDSANAIKKDGKTYTDATVKALDEALAKADKVYADEVAITSEVSAAGLALKNAINGMTEVVKTDISKAKVSGVTNKYYTGKTITQDKNIKVTLGKKTLVQNTDYKVSYKNNKNRGKATVTITGIGSYNGSCQATFDIVQKVTPEVTLSAKTFAYTGKAVTPKVVVKISGKTVSSTGYTVKMSTGRKALGTYKVAVTLKGYYRGTKTVAFKIVPKGTNVTKFVAGKNAFAVRWTAQKTQTTGYQIQCSTNDKFKSAKTVTVKGNSNVTKKVTNLAAKKKYYVRVRTYKSVGKTIYYSTWSKAKTVTTK